MKKEQKKVAKLQLARETLVNLDDRDLHPVAGGCTPWGTQAYCCVTIKTASCDC